MAQSKSLADSDKYVEPGQLQKPLNKAANALHAALIVP
jgi:hypothetical protein